MSWTWPRISCIISGPGLVPLAMTMLAVEPSCGSVGSRQWLTSAKFDGDLSFPGITQPSTSGVRADRQQNFLAVMLVVLSTTVIFTLTLY